MSLTKESVVVITGAASGIGRALAIRMAKEPIAGIAISDFNETDLAETASLIKNSGVKITTHIVDVGDEAQMRKFAVDVVEQHGRATHIINNAGVALGGRLEEISLEEIEWLMNINFWGVVRGTKFFLPVLKEQKSAHIVNISSIFGVIAPPGQTAYSASKFAVRGFTESLRHELDGTNITVSVVHPGGIKTNIANNARVGKNVKLTEAELLEQKEKFNEKLATTTPEKAAETILKGIKKRNTRIIIGKDASLLSLFARLFPRRYFGVLNIISGGKLKDK